MRDANYIGKGSHGNRPTLTGNLDCSKDELRQFNFVMFGRHTYGAFDVKSGGFVTVTEYPNGARVIVHK